MDKKINKHFCIQPFVNVNTRVEGQNNVCCNIWNKASNITDQSPLDFFNDQHVSDMRKRLLAGHKIDACRLCHYQEENSNDSHRIQYNNYYNIKNLQETQYYEDILKKLKISELRNPLYAEIHVSNLCNLKCLTCNERDSSRFHSENKILGISQEPNADYSICDIDKIKAIKSVITKDLLFLDVRGGETLMVPEIKKILAEIDATLSEKITLKIQTNGTILPDDDWIKIFKKFKKTKVNLSVDAYGEDNNYVRYPSDWSKIQKTILCLQKNEIKFIVNTVVSNINLLVLDKLFKWIQDNKFLNYFYILDAPTHYRPFNLPQSLLDIAVKRLQNVKEGFVNKDCNDKLRNLIGLCESQSSTKHWRSFCNEIKLRDKHRQNSITTVMPQIKEYIDAKI